MIAPGLRVTMVNDGRMIERCPHCGHPVPERARFCAECGALVGRPVPAASTAPPAPRGPDPAAPQAPAEVAIGAKTLMHFGAVTGPATTPPSPLPPQPTPQGSPAAMLHRTMLGMPAVAAAPAAIRGGAEPPAEPPAALATAKPAHKQTMMGVAMPGIAPVRMGSGTGTVPQTPGGLAQTLALPTAGEPAPAPPPVVPPPAPLSVIPPPLPPTIVRKGGVPIGAAALLAGGILLVGGLAIAWLWRTNAPITAQPRSSPDGKDVLHLHCEPASCKDGTVVEVGGARSTFVGGETDLTLVQTLRVGDNPLALSIDRPGMGRDEVLKLVVPVAYRVVADVAPMSGAHPSIVVRVQAIPGSEVTLDGKRLPLDGEGNGAYAIDESAATDGPADESRVLSADIPYEVVPKGGGAPEKGTVSARVPIAPLRVDLPRHAVVVDSDQIGIAGRAPKGANITVDGTPVAATADGAFETTLPLSTLGERAVEVRAGTPVLSPRTVHMAVKRVSSLTDEAKAFERLKPLGYDVAMSNLQASVGQPIVVEGEVIELRGSVMLVDDRRGCTKPPCATRIVLAQDLTVGRGKMVRAYGRIARPFATPEGPTVPEVEADFVVQAKR
jgi:hypothetical protein